MAACFMSLANDVSEIGSVPPPPSSSLPFPSHADLRQFQSPLRRRILLRRRRSPHWEPDRGGDPGGCEGELSRAVRVCGRSEFGGVWVVGGCEEDAGEEEGVSGGLGGGGFREGFFFSRDDRVKLVEVCCKTIVLRVTIHAGTV